MKQLSYILVAMLMVLMSACKKNEVSFTYSPTEPRAGQTITFSNHTEEGEEWSWNFGDGSSSTSKSPSKVYKKPGTYTVTLKVDDKARRTYSTSVTVYDTVPAIGLSDSIIAYFEPITLTAEIYNPYNYALTYDWHLPEGTIILDGDTASRKLEVCFTQPEQDTHLMCHLTQGEKVWNIDTTIYVIDTKSPSLVIATAGKLFHQRIYKYGFEQPILYSGLTAAMLPAPKSMSIYNEVLYIFNDDKGLESGIVRYDLNSGNGQMLIKNSSDGEGQGFGYGYANGQGLYWATGSYVYSAGLDKAESFVAGDASAMKVIAASEIDGLAMGAQPGGIMRYNDVYMYAYNKGIHRFSMPFSYEGTILTDQQIRRFTLDPIAQKIYFVSQNGLCVSLFDGSRTTVLDAQADGKGLAVDNQDNLLFWTRAEGVYYMPLVQAANNSFTSEAVQLNEMTNVTALAIDATKR